LVNRWRDFGIRERGRLQVFVRTQIEIAKMKKNGNSKMKYFSKKSKIKKYFAKKIILLFQFQKKNSKSF